MPDPDADRDTGSDPGPDDLAWETLASRTAYACDGFDVVNEDVRLPDGTETEFDYLSAPETVVVLPFTADDPADRDDPEVVHIEEWRQAVGRVNLGLPAGDREPEDDDLAAAARRELREETGHVAGDVRPLLTVEPANGATDMVFNYFVATGCSPAGDQTLDYNESIRVRTTRLSALREDVAAGRVRDGRTALGVLYHQLHG